MEIFKSKSLRSVEVLILRKNRIKFVEGPFGDLEDAEEKQKKKDIMKLKVLDLRENKLGEIFLANAQNFLRETVILMWDNPFENCKGQIGKELRDPSYMFRSLDQTEA